MACSATWPTDKTSVTGADGDAVMWTPCCEHIASNGAVFEAFIRRTPRQLAIYIILRTALKVEPACILRKRIQSRRHRRDHLPLRWCEVWMPNVKNQHHAQLVTVVPGLVFDSVVKHPGFAGHPAARLITYPKPAALWNDQRQMRDESRVGDTGMRRDTGVWFKQ